MCRLCGKGLCRKHCVAIERPVLKRSASGMAALLKPTGQSVATMLCKDCAAAVKAAGVPYVLVLE